MVSSTQLFLDNFIIYGHRLFGLPPTEPTYVCNWDLSFGSLRGECNLEFLQALIHGLKACEFSLDDVENALPPAVVEILHDITFLRIIVKSVNIWLRASPSAFLISTDDISFSLNDWANELYSSEISLSIPGLTLACVDDDSAQRQRGKQSSIKAETHAYVSTNISMSVFGSNSAATERRNTQQKHVREHDLRTSRTSFLLHPITRVHYAIKSETTTASPMSAPSMPPPLYGISLIAIQKVFYLLWPRGTDIPI